MADLIDWVEARSQILDAVRPLPSRVLPAAESRDHVLASPVIAPDSLPPFDNSAVDGFAVRAADVAAASPGSPVRLGLAGISAAGHRWAGDGHPGGLGSGRAVRIMTGAPIPPGADAVVPLEQTDLWDPEARRSRRPRGGGAGEEVGVLAPVPSAANIRRAGEGVRMGEEVLRAGHRLRPAEIALLLSLGITEVNVHLLPKVGLLSTGDELVEPSSAPGPGQIRDSNRAAILQVLVKLGYPALDLGLVRDDPAALEACVREALPRVDFLLTSGGVSVGDYDFTREVLTRMGPVRFRQVAVKPGKPQVFGLIGGTPVFGLPGNPVSSLVVFDVFVLPALRKMAGRQDLLSPVFTAELVDPVRHRRGRTEFVRVRLDVENGRWVARGTGAQGSGILTSMTRGNGYAIIPADLDSLEPGTLVSVQWMHWD